MTQLRGGIGHRLSGFDFEKYPKKQLSESFESYGSAQNFIDECDFIYAKINNTITSSCFSKDGKTINQILLWGDSYAQMLTYGLLKNLPSNWQLLQVSSRGCQANIFENNGSDKNYCTQSNYFAKKTIAEVKPKVVIISQNSDLSVENAQLFSSKLHELGVERVIFVGKPPEWIEPLPKLIFRRMSKPTPTYSSDGLLKAEVARGVMISASSLHLGKNDVYLNLLDVLCRVEGCRVFLGDNVNQGVTALDDRHLTPVASEYVVRHYLKLLFIQ